MSILLGLQLTNAGNHFADTHRQQQGDMHRGMLLCLTRDKALINGGHPAVTSKLLQQPFRTLMTYTQTMVPDLSRVYRFWYRNCIPGYLGNTGREVNKCYSRDAEMITSISLLHSRRTTLHLYTSIYYFIYCFTHLSITTLLIAASSLSVYSVDLGYIHYSCTVCRWTTDTACSHAVY